MRHYMSACSESLRRRVWVSKDGHAPAPCVVARPRVATPPRAFFTNEPAVSAKRCFLPTSPSGCCSSSGTVWLRCGSISNLRRDADMHTHKGQNGAVDAPSAQQRRSVVGGCCTGTARGWLTQGSAVDHTEKPWDLRPKVPANSMPDNVFIASVVWGYHQLIAPAYKLV